MNGLLWFIGLGALAGLTLFSTVFRRVRADLQAARDRGVPVAQVARYGGRASVEALGGRRDLGARLAGAMPTVQAGIVAMAATSIFIMVACFAASMFLAVR